VAGAVCCHAVSRGSRGVVVPLAVLSSLAVSGQFVVLADGRNGIWNVWVSVAIRLPKALFAPTLKMLNVIGTP